MTSRSLASRLCLALLVLLPLGASAAAPEPSPSPEETLKIIDKRLTFTSDYKGTIRIHELKKQNEQEQGWALELIIYRRDANKDLLFLITQPKHMAGSGYLRMQKNLWEYNPTVGQWSRTTVRANISGTFTCESDFDRSRLAEDYTVQEDGVEMANGTPYRKLLLTARSGAEVPFPLLRLWLGADSNIVKRAGYAPSGKLLRTDTIRSYQRLKDPLTGEMVLHFKEVIEEEAESGSRISVRYDEVQLAPLEANIFTKSWLEARSR